MKPLYKTTIIVWSPYDPTGVCTLQDLAEDATASDGQSYCSRMSSARINSPEIDPDWTENECFDDD